MTQCEAIKQYMQLTGGITPAEAMEEIGCYRLAARISDLRDQGVEICDKWVKKTNRFGKVVRFKRYSIEQ